MIEKETSPLLSGFEGRLGDIIIYKHRNRRCIRSMPAARTAPLSPEVIAQQERMAAIVIFYRALKAAGLYAYWQKAAEGMVQSGYNLLVKNNLPAFSGEGNICDFSKLLVTLGKVPLPDELTLARGEEEGEWILTWKNTPFTPRAGKDDRLKVAAMKDYETFEVEVLDVDDYRRGDGRAVFRMPERLKDYAHVYVIFCSDKDGKSSDSRYFCIG